MKVKVSRIYYLPYYLLFFLLILFYPSFITFLFLISFVLAVEIYRNFNYLEIKGKELFIRRGIFYKKIEKIDLNLVQKISLEKTPYLYILGLSKIVISSFGEKIEFSGIKNGEKIFKTILKIKEGK
ncbi:MAG: PH domain-containing protein [Candidatus Aenigmatarchaeota archaeon]